MLNKVKDGDVYYLRVDDGIQRLTVDLIGTEKEYFSDEIIGIELFCWPLIEGFGIQHKYETPKDCLIDLISKYVDKLDIINYVEAGKSNLDIIYSGDMWKLWKHNTPTVMERDKVEEYEIIASEKTKKVLRESYIQNIWNDHLINILAKYASIYVIPLYRKSDYPDYPFSVMKLLGENAEQIGYAVCDLEELIDDSDIEDMDSFLYSVDMEIDSTYITEEVDTFCYKLEERVEDNVYSLIDYQEGPFRGDDPEENGMIDRLGDEWIYAERDPEILLNGDEAGPYEKD